MIPGKCPFLQVTTMQSVTVKVQKPVVWVVQWTLLFQQASTSSMLAIFVLNDRQLSNQH